jgi:hypothetical protein
MMIQPPMLGAQKPQSADPKLSLRISLFQRGTANPGQLASQSEVIILVS